MGLYRKAKKIDDRLSESTTLYRVKKAIDYMLPAMIALLIAVLYFEFLTSTTHSQHVKVIWAERILLAYFVLELLVELAIYESNRDFLRHKWLDILLVVPFMSAILATMRVLKALKLVKPAKAAKTAKATKVTKTAKAARSTDLKVVGKGVKGTRKTGKVVKKGKELLEELFH